MQVKINSNTVTISKASNPPKIIVYPSFFRLSTIQQNAIIAHEIGHLAEQHCTTTSGLCIGISFFTGKNKDEIHNNKNFKKLLTIHERQAEILHKNAEWASTMRACRALGRYPGHLFLGHYAQLTKIDELYKLKDRLKKIYANSCAKDSRNTV